MISPMTNYSIRILTARSFIKTHQKRVQLALYLHFLRGRRCRRFTMPFSASIRLCLQVSISWCLVSAIVSGEKGFEDGIEEGFGSEVKEGLGWIIGEGFDRISEVDGIGMVGVIGRVSWIGEGGSSIRTIGSRFLYDWTTLSWVGQTQYTPKELQQLVGIPSHRRSGQ